MAWGKKDENDFGMTKEEFESKMQEAQTAREADAAKIADLETKVSGIDELRTQLAALRAPRQETRTQDEPTNFFEDPEKRMTERLNPIAGVAIDTKASLEEMRARNKFGKDFSRWGTEIDKIMEAESSVNKANPLFWENCINMVRGRHAAEIEESAQKGQYFFTEQPGGSGSGTGSNDSPESKLSPEELKSAKRLGMTPAEFFENQTYVMTQYGHGRVN